MSTFTWTPAPGASHFVEPKVAKAAFGGGYTQRMALGLNHMPRTWSLTFNRRTEPIDAIEAFVIARGGVESFVWVPPFGGSGKWICPSWKRDAVTGRSNSLSVTFEEVFGD